MKQDSCGFLLKQIHDAIRKRVDNRLRENGLTMTQVRLLMELGDSEDDALSLKELERHFRVAQSTIVGIVLRLEAKGFVQGYVASDDSRVKLVRLTPEGAAIREAHKKEIDELEELLVSGLTEREGLDLLRMLHNVYERIR